MKGIKIGLDLVWFLILFITMLAILWSIQNKFIQNFSEGFLPPLFYKFPKPKRKGFQLIEWLPWLILFIVGFAILFSFVTGKGFFGFFSDTTNYLANIFPWS